MRFLIASRIIVLILCFMLLNSCNIKQADNNKQPNSQPEKSLVKYAQGFDLIDQGDGKYLVKVFYPNQPDKILYTCQLSADHAILNSIDQNNCLQTPLDSIAVFSATQLNGLALLGLLDKVVGISESTYITNEKMKQRLLDGQTIELGNNGVFFVERTLALHPQVIFYSPYQLNQAHPLASIQQTMIPFMDFMETNPLGRAEWIKFTAAFMGNYHKADSIFESIVMVYDSLKSMAEMIEYRPTVLSDKYFADQWYVPGGKSYIATMLDDAGSEYVWNKDTHVASVPLNIETVLNEAIHADYWRIVGAYDQPFSYSQLASENDLYTHFKAFKNRKIIFCDSRKTGYFERGSMEPHVQLADLIFAFHPEILPKYTPVYYHLIP